jgi:uncharacterized phiE125 gp8 family phage protein
MLNTTVTTAPSFEPISLAVSKTHCRVYHTLDNDTFGTGSVGSGLITTARLIIENEIRGPIPNTGFTTVFDSWPAAREIVLPRCPLISVASVTYVDTASATITLSASTDYIVKSYNGMGRIMLRDTAEWPSDLHNGGEGVITVVYTAGYGASAAVIPEALKHAILLQIASLYEFRASMSPVQISVNSTIKNLISQYSNGNYV